MLTPLLSHRLCYVQSLPGHKSPVVTVSASETTGDIATACNSGEVKAPDRTPFGDATGVL